ncbi:MAG: hypothetical protein KGD73_10470, partial [Candidatus Lokiarchaeota archaeon]|nr:hypothetical protein [Candidatus Lokiarchaeota archaeon]
ESISSGDAISTIIFLMISSCSYLILSLKYLIFYQNLNVLHVYLIKYVEFNLHSLLILSDI